MKSHGGATVVSDQPSKPKKPKSRAVSSKFLSPTSSSTTSSSTEYGNQSPKSTLISPLKRNPRSSTDSRKHKSLESSGFLRGIWPSSSKPDTLADYLDNDRLKDIEEKRNKEKNDRNSWLLNKQRSCTEFSRFENDKKSSTKENHNPVLGGSMRYTGKFTFTRKSSNLPGDQIDHIVPGRLSVDENALRKKSFSRGLLSDNSDTHDSESEYSGSASFETPAIGKDFPASYMAPTVSSKKHGINVPSKFMHDLSSSRSRRWSGDSSDDNSNNSPKIFGLKNGKKKVNVNWALSPGRTGSTKGLLGLTSSKPPTSPSKGKGVGNILSLGIELLKGKKTNISSPLGPGSAENAHQLRILHNKLMMWRYSNASAGVANKNIIKQVESKFIYVRNELMRLQYSTLQKKLQLQKEKLNLKLNVILQSQIKGLESWGNMERQHSSSVSTTTDYLHSVVCRIPLVDGAKVEPHSASMAIRYASDLAASINLMLTTFSPTVDKTAQIVAELAPLVIQEKQLLQECLEHFINISALEMQERSLKSNIMQLRLLQDQHCNNR